MKTKFLSFAVIVTLITFFNCKQTNQEQDINLDFKYSDQPELLKCDLEDNLLIKEAIYAFENDLNNAYDNEKRSINRSYSTFIAKTLNSSFYIQEVASKHSLKLAKALQKSPHYKNNVFLYNSKLANCLLSSITNTNTKKSFEALKKANSLRPSVVLPTIRTNARSLVKDKGLAGILAFDYYYNSLMLLNENQLKTPINKTKNQKIDFNKVPKTAPKAIPAPKAKIEQASGQEAHNH